MTFSRFEYLCTVVCIASASLQMSCSKSGSSKSTSESGESVIKTLVDIGGDLKFTDLTGLETFKVYGLDADNTKLAFADGKQGFDAKLQGEVYDALNKANAFSQLLFELPAGAVKYYIPEQTIGPLTCKFDPETSLLANLTDRDRLAQLAAEKNALDASTDADKVAKVNANTIAYAIELFKNPTVVATCTNSNTYSFKGKATGLDGNLELQVGDNHTIAVSSAGQVTAEGEEAAAIEFSGEFGPFEAVTEDTWNEQVFDDLKTASKEGYWATGGILNAVKDPVAMPYIKAKLAISSQPVGQKCTLNKDDIYLYARVSASMMERVGAPNYYQVDVSSQKYFSDLRNIQVTCGPEPEKFSIGGTISGLLGTLVLTVDDEDHAIASGATTYEIPDLEPESAYQVSVKTQPSGMSCKVDAAGTTSSLTSNITDANIACGYTVGGTISGLVGTVSIKTNLGATMTISQNGAFVFPELFQANQYVEVSVVTDPSGHTCHVGAGDHVTITESVSNVSIYCY